MSDNPSVPLPPPAAEARGGESLLDKAAPWIGGGLLALPTLIARYPPMTDLPFHEGVIAVLRHMNDPSWFPHGLYHHNFGHPNQLFTIAGWLLSYVVPVTWACKLLIFATVVAIAVCAGRFAAHLGASRWTALVVAPVALGWTFYWGLVANLTGLAALLFVLPSFDRLAERPTAKSAGRAILGMVLLYFAHEAMMICGCVAIALLVVCHPLRVKDTLLRMSPAIFASGLFVGELRWAVSMSSKTVSSIPDTYMPLLHKIVTLPRALLGGHEPVLQYLLFGMVVLTVLVFALARWNSRGPVETTPRELAHHFRFELLAALFLAAYMAMPYTVDGATLIYHRFLPPTFAVFVVAIAPRKAPGIPRLAKVLAATLPLGSLFIVWPEFADSDRAYRELDVLLPLIDKNSAVAEIELGSDQAGRIFSMASGGARVLPERGGRLLYSLTDSPIAAVQMASEYQWNESLARIVFHTYKLRPSWDSLRYRYFIAHVPGGPIDALAAIAMAPDAKLLGTSGEWMLFESTHEVIPELSPDSPLPEPKPESLLKRMNRAYDEAVKESGRPAPGPMPLPKNINEVEDGDTINAQPDHHHPQ